MGCQVDANARTLLAVRLIVIGLVLETTLAALALLHGRWAWLVLGTSAALVASWVWWTQSLKKRRADGLSEPEAGEP